MSTFKQVFARPLALSLLALSAMQSHAQTNTETALIPAPVYESAFTGYQAQQDAPKLPWQSLFNADGSFVQNSAVAAPATAALASPQAVEVTVRKPAGAHAGHSAGRSVTLDTPPGKQTDTPTQLAQASQAKPSIAGTAATPAAATPATPAIPTAASPAAPASAVASDTRGTIESINKAEGKVKLKHGPIPKFDMPGMTMVFRVQDPKLLDQVKVGDQVGVTMQMTGSAIVITGFQK